jgi:large subunit ribosomal protein L25
VPLHFINAEAAPGVKMQGGVVSHVMNELDIKCLPSALPEFLEVDLSGLSVGQSVHISQIRLPAGVEVITHGTDPVVATLTLPRGAKSDDAAAAGEAEK